MTGKGVKRNGEVMKSQAALKTTFVKKAPPNTFALNVGDLTFEIRLPRTMTARDYEARYRGRSESAAAALLHAVQVLEKLRLQAVPQDTRLRRRCARVPATQRRLRVARKAVRGAPARARGDAEDHRRAGAAGAPGDAGWAVWVMQLPGRVFSAHSRGSGNPALGPRLRGDERSVTTYMRSNRFALPERILALSSAESSTVAIQSIAGGFITNGQSTANRMWSTPISMTQHNSAGLEKLPLVVM